MTDPGFKAGNDYEPSDIMLNAAGRALKARIVSPAEAELHGDPLLLLHFAGSLESALYEPPYSETTKLFLEAGHRVASFDLPGHGSRIDAHGDGITAFCNAFTAGEDLFQAFVEDGRALVEHALASGLARPGRIVACGTSRAGYMALRLMAAEPRVAAGSAIAPVTDWRALSEFSEAATRPDVAALAIRHYADSLTGRPIQIIIGNHDARVSTTACCRFYLDLVAANECAGLGDAHIDFQVADVPGHYSPGEWHIGGGRFLLKAALG